MAGERFESGAGWAVCLPVILSPTKSEAGIRLRSHWLRVLDTGSGLSPTDMLVQAGERHAVLHGRYELSVSIPSKRSE